MGCFNCFKPRGKDAQCRIEDTAGARANSNLLVSSDNDRKATPLPSQRSARKFHYRELAAATQNFKAANLIGQGGFGRVYKGRLDHGQVVAIKQLNREGLQGSKEFLVEVLMLIMLQHPNLVSLIGYNAEGDERLLVYEYMPKGSLEDLLFATSADKVPLDWNTRMKVAVGTAKGLTYLHDVANPPIIYRDMKAANILLDNEFNPKLSDFGLAKFGPVGDNTHVSTRVMGTFGYCAPDYAMTGKLTLKSDIYSFGVLLLELITGRRAFDASKKGSEQNLISWSRQFLSNRRKFAQLADPALHGCYPPRAFHQLVVIASMCLQDQPHVRPIVRDVAVALNHVASQPCAAGHDPSRYRSPPSQMGSPKVQAGSSTPSRTPNRRSSRFS